MLLVFFLINSVDEQAWPPLERMMAVEKTRGRGRAARGGDGAEQAAGAEHPARPRLAETKQPVRRGGAASGGATRGWGVAENRGHGAASGGVGRAARGRQRGAVARPRRSTAPLNAAG